MNNSRFLIALIFSFVSLFSLSQKETVISEWILLQNENGVKIEYRIGECNLPEQGSYTEEVYLKFTNTTEKDLIVDWSFDVMYGDKCYNCDGTNEEMNQRLKLNANTSKEGLCGDDNSLRLRIFSKFLDMENPEPMKSFHVNNVKVEIVKR